MLRQTNLYDAVEVAATLVLSVAHIGGTGLRTTDTHEAATMLVDDLDFAEIHALATARCSAILRKLIARAVSHVATLDPQGAPR